MISVTIQAMSDGSTDLERDLDLDFRLVGELSESESSFLLFSRRFAFDVSTSLSSSADE